MRPRTALLAILIAAGCGGTSPEPEVATDPVAADPGAPGGRQADRPRGPCAPYVDEVLACARKEAGAELATEEARLLAEDARDECREWMGDADVAARLPGALEACEVQSCIGGAFVWYECVLEELGVETYDRRAAGSGAGAPREWERIPPRPIPADVDPCEVYVEWVVACVVEATAEAGLPPDVRDQIDEAMDQACEAFRAEPLIFRALPTALQRCADVGCGTGGADLSMCLAEEIGKAATAP